MGDGEGRVEAKGRVPFSAPSEPVEFETTFAGRKPCPSCGEWVYPQRPIGLQRGFAFPPNCQVCGVALDPDDCPQSSPTSSPEKSESGGAGVDLDRHAEEFSPVFMFGHDYGAHHHGCDILVHPASDICTCGLKEAFDAINADVLALVERVRVLEAVAEAASSYLFVLERTASPAHRDLVELNLVAALAAAGGGDRHE